MVCLHGFTDTWRTWELVLPALRRRHDVLAPTLAGHAGGPDLPRPLAPGALADAVERQMDEAGFEIAHLVGNSLGGHVALELAARGRAASVVALAPAGGWEPGDGRFAEMIRGFTDLHRDARAAAPHAAALMATREGRRRATRAITVGWEHIPAELLEHQLLAAASCDVEPMVEVALSEGYPLEAEMITCPVRIVWGADDRLLPLPDAATRLRRLLPQAEWVELPGVGHCPQLDVPVETAQLVLDATA